MNKIIFISRAGCLLPSLIILNLLFGWMFFKPWQWLLVGLLLIMLFIFSSFIAAREIVRGTHRQDNIIDVEAEVIEDKKKLS